MKLSSPILLAILILPHFAMLRANAAPIPVESVQKKPDGLVLRMKPGVMKLQVWSDRIIRVTYAQGNELPAQKSLSVIGKPAAAVSWKLRSTPESIVVETKTVQARVDRKTGAVGFYDLKGEPILQEAPDGKEFAPSPVKEVDGTSVSQAFLLAPDERIYGLGQHQNGAWNYRGTTVHLQQKNMEVGVPVLLSSKGYGVLWDNPAVTDISVGTKEKEGVVEWTSEAGKAVDYYFLYGPAPDDVIRDYRALTGAAPLMPKWLWGFWQCKERYKTQKEMTDVVAEYRKRNVPIDGIIQDWQYWKPGAWGSHQFDPERFPDPAEMVKALHAMHTHVLISVWAKFDLDLDDTKELEQAGAMYAPVFPSVYPKGEQKWYDAFNPDGRRLYWKQISGKLFTLGFDGWWLDASEAELSGKWGELRTIQTAAGLGATVFNAWPLMHTTGIYRGQRELTDTKRVCLLTRSAYAGQQRNSAITWSGDIKGSWDVFAKQIPAGLNFSVSGIPYWNTDIGGFFGGKPSDRNYRELFTRWFQFGAFCPMFRVHGTGSGKELWQWDEPTQKILETYIRLRYRLMPYIYSTSWQVTHDAGTMMRPLVMDFADDPQALDIGDQYLFGSAMMVSPVTHEAATTRSVYLPGKSAWYDFWTGKRETGGQRVDSSSPIETMPIYLRAGSIVPLGPLVQYTSEKPADPIELRVYPGANGAFTLYEDEGDNYNYEKGVHSTIPFTWDEKTRKLTIGNRKGTFPGMLKERTFRVVWVTADHGIGEAPTEKPDAEIHYTGKAVTVSDSK